MNTHNPDAHWIPDQVENDNTSVGNDKTYLNSLSISSDTLAENVVPVV